MRNLRFRGTALFALVVGAFVASAVSASAVTTIETKSFTEPLGEVLGIAGTALGGIVIAGLVAMGTVALFKAGWSLGKRLIAKVA